MLQWGTTMPSNYLAQAGVIYDNNASIEAQLEKNHYSEVLRFLLLTISLGLKRRTDIRFCQEGSGIIAERVFQIAYPTQPIFNRLIQKILHQHQHQWVGQ
jgi:hypothetical protein